ncbi:MAG: ArnT family glycosyltransferase [Planctomycetota bacterium]
MRSPFLMLALLLHVALAGSYAWFTPAFEGPDENSHYEYAWHVGNAGELPVTPSLAKERGLPQTGGAVLAHHPPLYYALLGAAMAMTGHDDTVFGPRVNPDFGVSGKESRHLHFLHEKEPNGVLFWLRSVSVLLGAITIVLVHRLGRVCCPDAPRVADLAAMLTACLPMFSFLHGLLNNDVLATTLATASMLALAKLQRSKRISTGGALGTGLLVGLALLTKLTTLFLLGTVGLVLLLACIGGRVRWLAAFAGGAATLGIAGWLFWHNYQLYGDPLAMAAHDASFQPLPKELRWHYIFGTGPWPDSAPSFVPTVFTSLFGRFGWFSVEPHEALTWAGAGVAALSLLGLLAAPFERNQRHIPHPFWLLVLACLLVLGGTLFFNLRAPQPQGRLLFCAIGPAAVLVAAGLTRLTRALPGRRIVLMLLPATAVAAFFITFWPALQPGLAPAPTNHRTLVGGIVDAKGPESIAWQCEFDAPIESLPRLAWDDIQAPEGMDYTLYAFGEDGRVYLATHEWSHGDVRISGTNWTMPEALWTFLPKGVPVSLRLRRLPQTAEERPEGLSFSPPLVVTRK